MSVNPEHVRVDRTEWRDREISLRHRQWGADCPAVDLDLLLVEYNVGRPVALIEYKHFKAREPIMTHPTYRALSELATTSCLPFLVAFYWPNNWAFRIYPVNEYAKRHYEDCENMTEHEYVARLYKLRRLKLTETISGGLNTERPPEAEITW